MFFELSHEFYELFFANLYDSIFIFLICVDFINFNEFSGLFSNFYKFSKIFTNATHIRLKYYGTVLMPDNDTRRK